MAGKTKIVLDADVIIHFSKGGCLSLLPSIFPNYEYVVLRTVYNELRLEVKTQVDNMMTWLKNVTLLDFRPTKEMLCEYAFLTSKYGKGESACMAYCKFNHDVIGSSNLKDIKDYCHANQITYLTTIDFLAHAVAKRLMTADNANQFVADVVAKHSKLPPVDFHTYVSGVML